MIRPAHVVRCFVCAAAIIAVTAGSACARGSYIGLEGGLSLFGDSTYKSGYSTATLQHDTGTMFGIVLGGDYDVVRVEGELSYRKAAPSKVVSYGVSRSVSGSDSTVLSYMINGIHDFKTDFALTPFVGIGAGWVSGKLSSNTGSNSDLTFGYQFIAGVSSEINKNISIGASYRYQGSPDFNNNGESWSYDSNSFLIDARLNF